MNMAVFAFASDFVDSFYIIFVNSKDSFLFKSTQKIKEKTQEVNDYFSHTQMVFMLCCMQFVSPTHSRIYGIEELQTIIIINMAGVVGFQCESFVFPTLLQNV